LTDSRSQQYNSVMASPDLPTIVEILGFEVFREEHDGVNHGFSVKLSNGDIDDVQANDPRLTREMVGTFLEEQNTDQVRKWIGVAKFINYDVGTRPKHKCITKLMMWFDEAQGSVSSLNKGGQGCVSLPKTTAIPVLMQESTVDGKDIWMPFVGLVFEDVNLDQTRNIALAQYTTKGFETKDGIFLYYGNPTKNWQCSVRNGNIALVTNNENPKPERAHVVFPYQIIKVVSASPTCIVEVQDGNQIPVDPCFIHVPGFFNVDGDRNKPYLCTDLTGSRSYKDIYFRLRNQWEECAKLKANHVHANCIDLTTDFTPPDTRLSKQPAAAKPPASPDSDTPDGAAREGESVGDISSMQVDFIAESEDANSQATDGQDVTPTISPRELRPGGFIEDDGSQHKSEQHKSELLVMPNDSPDNVTRLYVTLTQMQEHNEQYKKQYNKNGLRLVDARVMENKKCRATYFLNPETYIIDIPDDDKRYDYLSCFELKYVCLCLHKAQNNALHEFWGCNPRTVLIEADTETFYRDYDRNKHIGENKLDASICQIVNGKYEQYPASYELGYLVYTCDRGSLDYLLKWISRTYPYNNAQQKEVIDKYINLVEKIWGEMTARTLRHGTLPLRQPQIRSPPVGLGCNGLHCSSQKQHREDDEFDRMWEEELQSDLSDGSLSAAPGILNGEHETGRSPGGSPDTPRLCVEAISIDNIYNKAMKFDPSACKALNAIAPSDQFAVSNHTFEFGVPNDDWHLRNKRNCEEVQQRGRDLEEINRLQDALQQYLEQTAIIVMNKYRVKKMLGWLRSYTNNKVHKNNLVTDCKEKFDEALANAQNTLDSLKRKYADLWK